MQTTLKQIDECVEAEIAAVESGKRLPVVKNPEPVSAWGFPIPIEMLRPEHEAAVKERARAKITGYRKYAQELRVKLMGAGIEPLAVLPGKVWRELCDQTGLYLLSPNAYGNVHLPADLIHKLRRDSPSWVDACIGVATTSAVVSIAFLTHSWLALLGDVYFFWGAFSVVTVVAGIWAMFLSCKWLANRRFRRAVRNHIAGKSWAEVLADLAPDRRLDGVWGGGGTKLVLPEPPPAVADILMRARKADLSLRVAAEADAVQFADGVEALLGEQYRQLLAAEEAVRRDPIIYVEHTAPGSHEYHNVVAIIAHFGDFPIEREVLDRVLGHGVI